MAEAVAVAAPQVAKEAKGGKGKILLVVAVVVVAAAGVVVGKMFLGGGAAEEAVPVEAPAPEEGEILTVASMTASLAGDGHFARVEFAAVLNAANTAADVESRFPLLKDAALSVIMSFDAETLRTVEGADQLRERLSERAREIYVEDEILRVILTDLLVQ